MSSRVARPHSTWRRSASIVTLVLVTFGIVACTPNPDRGSPPPALSAAPTTATPTPLTGDLATSHATDVTGELSDVVKGWGTAQQQSDWTTQQALSQRAIQVWEDDARWLAAYRAPACLAAWVSDWIGARNAQLRGFRAMLAAAQRHDKAGVEAAWEVVNQAYPFLMRSVVDVGNSHC